MMGTHHIAHVLPFPSVGGVEIAALRLMEGLEGGEFHNTAFHLREAGGVARKFTGAGFDAVSYEPVEPSYRSPRAFLQNSVRLAREFRRRGISLVHCQDVMAAYYAGLAGRLAGVPVLCHVRSQRPDISRREAGFLLPVNRFAFVSRDAWECFGVKVRPSQGAVVYDGFDFTAVDREQARRAVRQEFNFPADAKIVGMVARIARQKDYETLVRAAARVVAADASARFLIVGDYEGQPDYRAYYREVQAMVAAAGLKGHFVFTGQREDVVRLMAAMDVSVLCTHTEGFALAVLEAMAQGVPLIATAVGGLPEFVVEEQTGLLHQHGDDAELAAKVLRLLREPMLAERLSAAGRRLTATTFTRQRTAAEVGALYREMITGRRAAGGNRTLAGAQIRFGEAAKGGDQN